MVDFTCINNKWHQKWKDNIKKKSIFIYRYGDSWASQVAQWLKKKKKIHLPMQETQVWSLGREDPLEEEMAVFPPVLLPGNSYRQRSLAGLRVRHDLATESRPPCMTHALILERCLCGCCKAACCNWLMLSPSTAHSSLAYTRMNALIWNFCAIQYYSHIHNTALETFVTFF